MRQIKRELIIAAVILVATVVVLFPITYVVGGKTLGPFGEDGSLGDFMGSLFVALADGNLAIWFFLLTPLAAIAVVRVGWLGFKKLKPQAL
ncbi:MAG: hypothetical protein AAF270_00700 [Pseudomonadota bacterium]